jgi:hypothetical protein
MTGRIRVHVTDNVPVAKVLVNILNEQDEAASAINDRWWAFETVTLMERKVSIETFDLAQMTQGDPPIKRMVILTVGMNSFTIRSSIARCIFHSWDLHRTLIASRHSAP